MPHRQSWKGWFCPQDPVLLKVFYWVFRRIFPLFCKCWWSILVFYYFFKLFNQNKVMTFFCSHRYCSGFSQYFSEFRVFFWIMLEYFSNFSYFSYFENFCKQSELIFGATSAIGGCVNFFVSCVNFLKNNAKCYKI